MLDADLGSTTLGLTLATFGLAGIIVAFFVANLVTAHGVRIARDLGVARAAMPDAARLEQIPHQLRERERELSEAEQRLGRVRQEVAEAERAKLDAQQWRELAEQAKRDYDGLAGERQEIDRVRGELERALAELADARGELVTTRQERAQLQHDIEALTSQVRAFEDKQREMAEIDAKIGDKRAALEEIRAELSQTQDLRAELKTAKFELEESRRRLDAVQDSRVRASAELERIEERQRQLEAELRPLEELRQDRDRLVREASEVERAIDDLGARRSRLEGAVGSLEEREKELRETIEQQKAQQGGNAGGSTNLRELEVLSDLRQQPAALFESKAPLLAMRDTNREERSALERVEEHLTSLGLHFDPRIVKRFHTCLKTGRISPLTVLAGISGTGKSQLPQRYAEAIGIHFLKIAVQPRWDSPQDLFGFYNYLEKKYRATELARALVYMDPLGNDIIDPRASTKERMLLVLLDEMNLARVEYYFSEFLSRLEGRPAPHVMAAERVRPSRIEIEIGIGEHIRASVYPGHNVLFAGTMNEDESTQSLSDKVLDRTNLIRFPRPKELRPELRDTQGKFATAYLPFKTWAEWHVPETKMPQQSREAATSFIAALNEELGHLRRPFGHRVNQAILSYVANHPEATSVVGCREALSDMLQLRVLPKLRGIENDDRAIPAFQRIEQLVRARLEDVELATSINTAATESDTFDWIAPG